MKTVFSCFCGFQLLHSLLNYLCVLELSGFLASLSSSGKEQAVWQQRLGTAINEGIHGIITGASISSHIKQDRSQLSYTVFIMLAFQR